MRSGTQGPDDEGTRQFKAQSQRLMGDINEAGDAPFGGELQLDPQVPSMTSEHLPGPVLV